MKRAVALALLLAVLLAHAADAAPATAAQVRALAARAIDDPVALDELRNVDVVDGTRDQSRVRSLGTVTARLGYSWDRWLGYVKGGAAWEGVDLDTARARLEQTDNSRARYVRQLYRVDPTNASLYQLVVDATVLTIDSCVDLVVAAAEAAWAFERSAPTDAKK